MRIGYFLSTHMRLIDYFLPNRDYFRNNGKNAGRDHLITGTKTNKEQ